MLIQPLANFMWNCVAQKSLVPKIQILIHLKHNGAASHNKIELMNNTTITANQNLTNNLPRAVLCQ